MLLRQEAMDFRLVQRNRLVAIYHSPIAGLLSPCCKSIFRCSFVGLSRVHPSVEVVSRTHISFIRCMRVLCYTPAILTKTMHTVWQRLQSCRSLGLNNITFSLITLTPPKGKKKNIPLYLHYLHEHCTSDNYRNITGQTILFMLSR